jgi:hypothetical protein
VCLCNFLAQAQAQAIALGSLAVDIWIAQVPVKPLKYAVVYALQ